MLIHSARLQILPTPEVPTQRLLTETVDKDGVKQSKIAEAAGLEPTMLSRQVNSLLPYH